MTDDVLIHDGGAVKSLGDGGRVGGYLVLWGSPEATDTVRDYFAPDTDFGRVFKAGADVLFHHGLPRVGKEPNPLADRVLGDAEVKADETGLWMEAVLGLRDEYERRVFEMVKAGKLGLSSGTASHLMRRARQPNGSSKITRWPVVEASLTPTPAEPRTRVYPIKSLLGDDADAIDIEESNGPGAVAAPTLVDRSRRLVADARELLGLVAKARDQRASEGRDISPDKRGALKAMLAEHRELVRAIEEAAGQDPPPPVDPAEFRALLDRARDALRPRPR